MNTLIISNDCKFIKLFYNDNIDEETNIKNIYNYFEQELTNKNYYNNNGETKTYPGLLSTNVINKYNGEMFNIKTYEESNIYITLIKAKCYEGEILISRINYNEAAKDHFKLSNAIYKIK